MTLTSSTTAAQPQVSHMAENLIGSEIIRLAGEVNELMKQGQKVYNLTIGDFDPNIFPIPTFLKQPLQRLLTTTKLTTPPPMALPSLGRQYHTFYNVCRV